MAQKSKTSRNKILSHRKGIQNLIAVLGSCSRQFTGNGGSNKPKYLAKRKGVDNG